MENSQEKPVVLIVDDDASIRTFLRYNLDRAGMVTVTAASGDEAIACMTPEVSVVLLDLQMPGMPGMECLGNVRARFPDAQVIIITGSERISDAVTALKAGAFDYITKPLDIDALILAVRRAVGVAFLAAENQQLRRAIGEPRLQASFVWESPETGHLIEQAGKIADLDSTVLITGESGVGKGVLAKLIHSSGLRADGPFVTVSCTALPRELVEAELFGHEKGAFTGAYQKRPGRVELADGGTLFLDEIGDMPLDLQPKLLSFLQERSFHRVGGTGSVSVNVRIIAATHQNLAALCREKRFREDLFFRINVIPLHLPPLRERRQDIAPLVRHILNRIAHGRGTDPLRLSDAALEALTAYALPGNARELENILEHSTAFCNGSVVEPADLPPQVTGQSPGASPDLPSLAGLSLEAVEKQAIEQTLKRCGGNKSRAAKVLGISEKSIYNKMKRLNISGVL